VEIRQQLARFCKLKSRALLLNQPLPANASNVPPVTQSQANLQLNPQPQQTFGTPISLIPPPKPVDIKSPLSKGLQTSPWPPTYEPISLPKHNGWANRPSSVHNELEVAIASAGGNDTVLAKSFVIAEERDTLA
jgi:hypothetical protein